MLELADAQQRILLAIEPLPPETVFLDAARDRFAASTLLASVALPSFDHSSMDGYAVLAADTKGSVPLPVIAEQPAGLSRDLLLPPGAAIRIFTGAPMPAGADAVIMQEDVEVTDCGVPNPEFPAASAPSHIVCREPVEPRENVRFAGSDLCEGQRILSPGQKLHAARLAMLASQGLETIDVHGLPRVAIVTTGDELQMPGQPLRPGQIYNSNGLMLQSLCASLGIPPKQINRLHLSDELEPTVEALKALVAQNDFVILSGGVSVGDHDYVKPALAKLKITPDFWRIRVRPGKPLLFAQATQSSGHLCYLFGLPGNPVSSYVTFTLLVRAALLKASGATEEEWQTIEQSAEIVDPLSNRGERPFYMFGYLEGGKFNTGPLQQSHAIFGLSQANAMVCVNPGEQWEAGVIKPVMRL